MGNDNKKNTSSAYLLRRQARFKVSPFKKSSINAMTAPSCGRSLRSAALDQLGETRRRRNANRDAAG
jgi:hypothetical protein